MTYQELLKSAERVAMSDKIQVVELDGMAWKLFDKSFTKAHVFYEAMIQTLAENTGVLVPKVHGIEEVEQRYAIVTDYVDGKTFEELMEENPQQTEDYIRIMVEQQTKIHEYTPSNDFISQRNLLLRKIGDAPLSDVQKYGLLTSLSSMPYHTKLCHGNFGPENLMMDGLERVYVLDWVAAASGNAAADAARTYLKLVLKKTQWAEQYLKLYCEKNDTERSYVEEWLPIIAAAALTEKKVGEKEKKVLLTWLDIT